MRGRLVRTEGCLCAKQMIGHVPRSGADHKLQALGCSCGDNLQKVLAAR